MANPYVELLKTPGCLAFTLSGLVARLALPMIGIGIITMLVQSGYGYGLAGTVSATVVLCYAVISPQVSRLFDLYGQGRIVLISATTCTIGLILLALSSHFSWANWTLYFAAFLAGFSPSLSSMVRARWSAIYSGQPQLNTAFSLESVIDELTFIIGPPISIGLSVALFEQAGIVVAAVLLILGAFLLSRQYATAPHNLKQNPNDVQQVNADRSSVIKLIKIQLLIIFMFALGMMVGTIEIASVAFAEMHSTPTAAGIVLSAYAVGSCVAGLVFGAIKLNRSFSQLLLWAACATLLSTLPLLWVTQVYSLAVAVFIAGLAFSPCMIIAMGLVEQIVPSQKLTEALAWLVSGLNVGVAFGAAFSGQMVECYASARAGFWVIFVAVNIMVIFALIIHHGIKTNNA